GGGQDGGERRGVGLLQRRRSRVFRLGIGCAELGRGSLRGLCADRRVQAAGVSDGVVMGGGEGWGGWAGGGHVSDLPGGAGGSPQRGPVHVAGVSQTRADPQHAAVVQVLRAAGHVLGGGGELHVAFERDRARQRGAQRRDRGV